MKITTYDLDTGTLRAMIKKSDEQTHIPKPTQGFVDGHYDGNLYYVDIVQNPVAVVARNNMGLHINKTTFTADGITSCTISNIPDGTTCVILKGHELVCDDIVIDNTIELSSEQTGRYTVTLTHPRYIKQIIEVEAI